MKNILTKELKEAIIKVVSLLEKEWDSVSIGLNEEKGLFIQLEYDFDRNKGYFIELNDIDKDDEGWYPCASYNAWSVFGDMENLIKTIESYLEEEL